MAGRGKLLAKFREKLRKPPQQEHVFAPPMHVREVLANVSPQKALSRRVGKSPQSSASNGSVGSKTNGDVASNGHGPKNKVIANGNASPKNNGGTASNGNGPQYKVAGASNGNFRRQNHGQVASNGNRSPNSIEIAPNGTANAGNPRANQTPEQQNGAQYGVIQNGITNFVPLHVDSDKGVFEYEVRFSPSIDDKNMRFDLLRQQSDIIGRTKTFDGVTLCLPFCLPAEITELVSINRHNDSEVLVTIIFKKQYEMKNCRQLYNVLFNRIMHDLKFVRFRYKFFDPSRKKRIQQHKLEIWPGFDTSVEEYSGGTMVCIEVTYRVLSTDTVLDRLRHGLRHYNNEFKNKVTNEIVGSIVLTRFNNKTYSIDSIDFDANPTNTFNRNGRDISFVDYYKEQFGITIKDLKQPLLVHRKRKDQNVIYLVPEICYCTGITDELRSNWQIMRDIAMHTNDSPHQKTEALKTLCETINSTASTRNILRDWGLTLDNNALPVEYRQFGEEKVYFGGGKSYPIGPKADFTHLAKSNRMLHVVELVNWMVMCTAKDEKVAIEFIDSMCLNARPMGMNVYLPQIVLLEDDRSETWANALRANLTTQTQTVICICPTRRDDRYSLIKRICRVELPVPSQVAMVHTLTNPNKKRSVVQSMIMQINCKLGGSLWMVPIPLRNTMIAGIDTFHDAKNRSKSVSAFSASIDPIFTKWYSKSIVQERGEELGHGLTMGLSGALKAYRACNNKLPERIVIYRDGVSDGQLGMCRDYELPQLRAACKSVGNVYNPKFAFVVAQKRVKARFYALGRNGAENPLPGAVLDHTVTHRNSSGFDDFYLVSKIPPKGTTIPTHFVVVTNEIGFSAEIIQRLTYKLCFMYFNVTSAIRVPASCQYSHKLASLVGQSVKRETSEKLAEQLHFL